MLTNILYLLYLQYICRQQLKYSKTMKKGWFVLDRQEVISSNLLHPTKCANFAASRSLRTLIFDAPD